MFYGDRPTSIFCTLPLSGPTACVLVEPDGDCEDGDEPEGGVTVEPFAVYGPKGG